MALLVPRPANRAEVAIVGGCLAGTKTRRVRRVLRSLFGGIARMVEDVLEGE